MTGEELFDGKKKKGLKKKGIKKGKGRKEKKIFIKVCWGEVLNIERHIRGSLMRNCPQANFSLENYLVGQIGFLVIIGRGAGPGAILTRNEN